MYLLYLSVPAMLVVMLCHCAQLALRYRLDGSICPIYSPNVSTTPITAMGCRQCLPLSVVQLKGKHCQKPHCRNGVVDTFGHSGLHLFKQLAVKSCDLSQAEKKITVAKAEQILTE